MTSNVRLGRSESLVSVGSLLLARGGTGTATSGVLRDARDEDFRLRVEGLVRERGVAAVLAVLGEDKPQAHAHSRFSSASAGHRSGDVEPLRFYDADAPPQVDAASLPRQVAEWQGYCGELWLEEERDDIVCTCAEVARRSRSEVAVPVALFTMMVTKRVVWAASGADGWVVVGDSHTQLLEAAYSDDAGVGVQRLARVLAAEFDAAELAPALEKGHKTDDLHGITCRAAGALLRLVRYTRSFGGPDDGTLADTVAWLLPPGSGEACFDPEQTDLPPAGVLETLQSLAVYDNTASMPQNWPWKLGPSLGSIGERLAEKCLMERNQQQYSRSLHQRWQKMLVQAPEQPRTLASARVGLRPAPGDLLHSVEIQWLRPEGGEIVHLALSSAPKLMLWHDGSVRQLQRLDREAEQQPYWVVNHAMRSAHQRRNYIELVASKAGLFDGKYAAPCPVSSWQPSGLPVLVSPDGTSASWDPQCGCWAVNTIPIRTAVCHLNVGTLMLQQVVPMIQHMDAAIAHFRADASRPLWPGRLYRGLTDVKLDVSVYSPGQVVLWSQYSSSSADMSVATGFATGGESAVFSIVGDAVQLSKMSRFAREREWLFPADTLFLVESSLSEEFAELLGKESLQLFDLRVVSQRQSLALRIRTMMSQVRGMHSKERVGGLFNLASMLDDSETPLSEVVATLLAPGNGTLGPDEAGVLLQPLCGLARMRTASSTLAALHRAVGEMEAAAVAPLVLLGADPSGLLDGQTPLHVAAKRKCPRCVDALLRSGAQPLALDSSGMQACQVAAAVRSVEVVRRLGKHAALPPDLAELYEPMQCYVGVLNVLLALFAVAFAASFLSAPAVRYTAPRPVVPPSDAQLVGFGACRSGWGTTLPVREVEYSDAHECVHMIENGTALGVVVLPSVSGPTCRLVLKSSEGGARVRWGFAQNTPTPEYGPGLVEYTADAKKKRITCWRDKSLDGVSTYSYVHLGNPPPRNSTGYAPEHAGVDCPIHGLSNESGVWMCANGTLCFADECCAGDVLHCPPDRPVRCDCAAGPPCCVREAGKCAVGLLTCPGRPFRPCVNNAPCDAGDCDSAVTAAGVYGGVDCPTECGCPGSVQAEHYLEGAQSLLNDNMVSDSGQGCIDLSEGIRMDFTERLTAVLTLSVVGPLEEVELAVVGGEWETAPVESARPGEYVVRAPACLSAFQLRTSSRVCEVVARGDTCGDLYVVASGCLPPLRSVLSQEVCLTLLGNHTDRVGHFQKTLLKSQCLTSIPASRNTTRLLPLCEKLVPRSSVAMVRAASPTPCHSHPDEVLPFSAVFTRFHTCLEILNGISDPRTVVAGTWLTADWGEVDEGYCLLHNLQRVHPDLNVDVKVTNLRFFYGSTTADPLSPGHTIAVPSREIAGERMVPQGLPPPNSTSDPKCYAVPVHVASDWVKPAEVVNAARVCEQTCLGDVNCAAVFFRKVQVNKTARLFDHICCYYSGVGDSDSSTMWQGYIMLRRVSDVSRFERVQFACYQLNFGRKARPDSPYRMVYNQRCPPNTVGTMSEEECRVCVADLGLPTAQWAPGDLRAEGLSGCTYTSSLQWGPGHSDGHIGNILPIISVCMLLPEANVRRSIAELWRVDGDSAAAFAWSACLVFVVLVQFCVLCTAVCLREEWSTGSQGAACSTAGLHVQARRALTIVPLLAAVVMGFAAVCGLISTSNATRDMRALCRRENRPHCYVSVSSAPAMGIVAAFTAGLAAASLRVRAVPCDRPSTEDTDSTAAGIEMMSHCDSDKLCATGADSLYHALSS